MNSKTVTAELKACPFCGGIPASEGRVEDNCRVMDLNEGCPLFDIPFFAQDWNTRAADPQRAKLVEALKKIESGQPIHPPKDGNTRADGARAEGYFCAQIARKALASLGEKTPERKDGAEA